MQKNSLSQNQHLPVGLIGECSGFSWGFNGSYYYVAEGCFQHLVTRIQLTLEEAKQLCTSFSFNERVTSCPKRIGEAIKSVRRMKLTGDDMMWFFTDALESKNK